MGNPISVLVVDDIPSLADLYTTWLDDEYDVETVYGGEEAIEAVDDDTDVVLLDRRMPELSGDTVLSALRDRGVDCQIALITAVDPGPDVLDLPFDDYLTKPVSEADLRALIERLRRRADYDGATREYLSLAARLDAAEAGVPEPDLAEDERYAAVRDRLAARREAIDDLPEEVDRDLRTPCS